MEALHMQLHREQEWLLWQSVERLLESEAAEADAGSHAHALAKQLIDSALHTDSASTSALAPLMLSLYLNSVDGASAVLLVHSYVFAANFSARPAPRVMIKSLLLALWAMNCRHILRQ
jgi:hypothetical protein